MRILKYFTLPLAAGLLASCSSSGKQGTQEATSTDSPKPVVVASIPPMEYFAKAIGGDKIEIVTLASTSTDPETFEPTMSQMRKASTAKMFISTGLLPFEQSVATALDRQGDISLVNLADSLRLITGTHGHDESDPHIWTSLRNAATMARMTHRALVEAIPNEAPYFTARLDSVVHRLDSLDTMVSRELEPVRGRSFLVWHPSLTYFARDYGLDQISVGEEHKELSAGGLRDRINSAKERDALLFFTQKEYDSRQSETIVKETGLRAVDISPLSADIEATIMNAAEALSAAN